MNQKRILLGKVMFCIFLMGIFNIASATNGNGSPGDFTILMVDDFPSAEFPWQNWSKSSLDKLGVRYEIVTTEEINQPGNPARVRLEDYPAVMWHTGLEQKNTLTSSERFVIGQYLEGGGSLVLTSMNAADELAKSGKRWWLKRYLRCDFLMPNSPLFEGSVYEFEPLVGGDKSIFKGIRFFIDHGEYDTYAADDLNLIYEECDPIAGGGGAIHCASFERIAGNLGIEFEGPVLPGACPCKLVFLTFPLETVHPEPVRMEMLKRILEFFRAPDKTFFELRGTIKSGKNPLRNPENTRISLKNTPFYTYARRDGSFILTGITKGSYTLEANLFGYTPVFLNNIRIPPDNIKPLEISLVPFSEPIEEGRGVWIVRDIISSPEAIKKIVERSCNTGFNALFVQVRGRGDAYYISETEPRADSLSDQPPDFDPLALFIELAHTKNMQVHAWMNAFYTYQAGVKPTSPKHVINRHPEWVLTNRAGKSLWHYTKEEIREHPTEGAYLSPCIPAVREYLANVYMEVVKKYDVDGIHFDFIRFPSSGNRIDSDWDLGYSKLSREAFKKEHGLDPMDIDPEDLEKVKLWDDWRRLCVSRLVEDVHKRAHAIKPDIRVSGAVLERYHLARDSHCFQDWLEWLQNGKIDTCCVMAYNTDNPLVANRIRMAVENRGKGTVWAGMSGSWRRRQGKGVIESIIERVELVRRQKPEGVMFFAYKHFSDEEFAQLKEKAFSVPAKVPGAPSNLR